MSDKLYITPPRPMRTMIISQIVIGVLFLPLGIAFVFISEGEARPFAAMFAVIWIAGCAAMIIHSVKVLGLMKKGKFQIGEIKNENEERTGDVTARLRELEKLKEEKLISAEEYGNKRAEIMKEKW
ncbi:MAG: hypothetical protein ABIG55_04995 [Candidatus Omnitrophota bacterium]|nr:hypothetical protein [Candidatus Omnitrophota bacterium]